MASRHLSRSLVLQTLFECDMQGTLGAASREVLARNLKEFPQGDVDVPFAEVLLENVLAKKEETDAVMVKAAPEWPLDKIAPIDRNVLRIGLYELLFGDKNEVPPKVALNEAIELAKSYGGDSSGKFVNGVLGSVYRSIDESGKTETPKDSTPLPHESLGGMMVTAIEEGQVFVALVQDAFEKWTLPKARCAENELPEAAAARSAKAALGIDGKAHSSLGEHEYIAHESEAGRTVRTVSYFLALTPQKISLTPAQSSGIHDARWFSEAELATMNTYADLMPTIEAGIAAAKHA